MRKPNYEDLFELEGRYAYFTGKNLEDIRHLTPNKFYKISVKKVMKPGLTGITMPTIKNDNGRKTLIHIPRYSFNKKASAHLDRRYVWQLLPKTFKPRKHPCG